MLIDENRINDLFYKYYERIYHFCLSYTQNYQDADDIAQQTFIILMNKASQLEDVKLDKWLYKTARLELCKLHKTKKREISRVPFRIDDSINEDNLLSSFNMDTELDYLLYPDDVIEEHKETILNKLSDKDQYLYKAVFEENKSYREIAEELGISENTVNVRSFRLRAKLKDIIKTTISLILITFYYIFM